jgi:hypothetical protein
MEHPLNRPSPCRSARRGAPAGSCASPAGSRTLTCRKLCLHLLPAAERPPGGAWGPGPRSCTWTERKLHTDEGPMCNSSPRRADPLGALGNTGFRAAYLRTHGGAAAAHRAPPGACPSPAGGLRESCTSPARELRESCARTRTQNPGGHPLNREWVTPLVKHTRCGCHIMRHLCDSGRDHVTKRPSAKRPTYGRLSPAGFARHPRASPARGCQLQSSQ